MGGFPARGRAVLESLEPRQLLAGDLAAHWLADDLVASLGDGDQVDHWFDRVAQISADRLDGSVRLVTDRLGGRAMVRFDGDQGGDNLVVPKTVNPMAGAQDFSIVVAFATTATDLRGGLGYWFQNTGLVDGSQLGLTQDWGISLNQAGQIGAGLGREFAQPTTNVYSSATGLNDGQLHVAAFTRQQGTISVYVDGGPADSRADADTRPRANLDLMIGSLLSHQGYFSGEIAEVRIYDGQLSEAEVGEVSSQIIIYYSNRPPVSIHDTYQLDEDEWMRVLATEGVLANDLDDDGDELTAVLVDAPQHGQLNLLADGSFFYVPDMNYVGEDSFSYRAVDFRASEETATVTLQVRPVHDPVEPVADQYKGTPNESLIVPVLSGVLVNDLNVDQSPMTAILVDDVQHGQLTLLGDGSFRYDPQGFAGIETFRYRVDDGTALSESTEVTLVINTPPAVVSDVYIVAEDTLLSRDAATGVLANDQDVDGDLLTAQLDTSTAHGNLTFQSDGSFQYAPAADFFGDDLFSYRVSDGVDESTAVYVQIQVQPVNDPPTTLSDTYIGLPDQVLQVGPDQGVLSNDSDIDSPSLRAILAVGPTHGQLILEDNGAFSYTPAPGFTGADQFRYRASDSLSETAEAVVTLRITPQPVIISEFMASNAETIETYVRATPDDRFEGELLSPDWIELRNLLSVPLDLDGVYLTDDPLELQKWQFPAGTIIAPDGYLVVFASGRDIRDPALDEQGWLHTNFQLSTSPDYLALVGMSGQVIHEFAPEYPPQRTHVSYGVQGTSSSEVGYFLQPTPGAPNASLREGLVADTQFSIDRGFFTEPIQLQITTATPDATIRYTTDGTAPSESHGQLYSGPLTIDKTTTLRAMAYRADLVPTNVDTHSYFFLQDVIEQTSQSTLEAGFPSSWRGTAPDYGLDSQSEFPRIAGDRNMPLEDAKQAIVNSLLAVPTLVHRAEHRRHVRHPGDLQQSRGHGRAVGASHVVRVGLSGRHGGISDRCRDSHPGRSLPQLRTDQEELVPPGIQDEIRSGAARVSAVRPGCRGRLRHVDPAHGVERRLAMGRRRWTTAIRAGRIPAPHPAGDGSARLARHAPCTCTSMGSTGACTTWWSDRISRSAPPISVQIPTAGMGSIPAKPINADGDRFRNTRTQGAWRTMQNLARDVQRAGTQEEKTALLMQLQGLNPDGTREPGSGRLSGSGKHDRLPDRELLRRQSRLAVQELLRGSRKQPGQHRL